MSDIHYHQPFTVGVSIAALLIFLIAIFHIWKLIFKKIIKHHQTRWDSCDDEVIQSVETEIPLPERKLSSACVQQLKIVLENKEEVLVNLNNCKKSRPAYGRSISENNKTTKFPRKKSFERSLRKTSNRPIEPSSFTLFAGYIHKHVDEV